MSGRIPMLFLGKEFDEDRQCWVHKLRCSCGALVVMYMPVATKDPVEATHGGGEARRVFTIEGRKPGTTPYSDWVGEIHRYEEGRRR